MIVVLAADLHPAVRGRMKLWFIEIKPGVFVSGVKDSVAKNVVDYLYESCDSDTGIIIIESISKSPFYSIKRKGRRLQYIRELSGLSLVFDRNSVGKDTQDIV